MFFLPKSSEIPQLAAGETPCMVKDLFLGPNKLPCRLA